MLNFSEIWRVNLAYKFKKIMKISLLLLAFCDRGGCFKLVARINYFFVKKYNFHFVF